MSNTLLPIREVARKLEIPDKYFEQIGSQSGKIQLELLSDSAFKRRGKLIIVTATTPTAAGEGKTVTSISLTQGLAHIGKKVVITSREPSLGPVFGMKGGAAGGGLSQIEPSSKINLHFNGDFHAISSAHNLLAALVDAHLFHGNELNLDPAQITWPRAIDMNDRALRHIRLSLDSKKEDANRQSGFIITAASEIMAIIALARDRKDLRRRLDAILIGVTRDGKPVCAKDLSATGGMMALLSEAILPNLAQTTDGTPAFVHAGPFGNIAHGNSSIVADQIALKLVGKDGYVLTESGFGADMGMEKFFNIKCRYSGLVPDCVVMVATIRALKTHGGGPKVVAGQPLDPVYTQENLELLEKGSVNLVKMIENARKYGLPVVVGVNRFQYDTPAEVELVCKIAKQAGAVNAVMTNHWAEGGAGAVELGKAVIEACKQPGHFKFLYPLDTTTIKQKIETIVKEMYGGAGVEYSPEAEKKIALYTRLGFDKLPICMAKTQYSLSHDPNLKGAPSGFIVPVRDVRASVGAGFVYPLLGTMSTMPGLSTRPGYYDIDLDLETGQVVGLS